MNNNFAAYSRQYGNNVNTALTPNYPIQQRPTFINRNEILDNNMPKNLLNEEMIDSFIIIDCDDRNIQVYPDPFKYVTSFNAVGKSVERKNKKNSDGSYTYSETVYDETPAPVILRNFKNVKRVVLDNVILSRYSLKQFVVSQTLAISMGLTVSISPSSTLAITQSKDRYNPADTSTCPVCFKTLCICPFCDRYKFIVLRIKELETNRIFSTNIATSDNAFILVVDKTLGNNNNTWKPTFGKCDFPDNALGNINRMTISFYDRTGLSVTTVLYIVYNFSLTYNSHTYTQQYCLLFGTLCDKIMALLQMTYPTIFQFNIGNLYNQDIWMKKVFHAILNADYTAHGDQAAILGVLQTLDVNNNYVAYTTIYNDISSLDITDEYTNCSTNNIFLTITSKQNELNMLTNYEQ